MNYLKNILYDSLNVVCLNTSKLCPTFIFNKIKLIHLIYNTLS